MTKNAIIALMTHIWNSNKGLVIFSMIFIALIQVLLIYFNSTIEIGPIIEFVMSQMDPQFKKMYGEYIMSQISHEGTIAFGLEHPLVITLISFIGISIVTRNLSSSSENKFMEIILSHPVKRSGLILTVYTIGLFILALLIVSTISGAVIATQLFHEMDPMLFNRILLTNLNAYLLHVFILSMATFLTVTFRDSSSAVKLSAVIILVFYFINILRDYWDSLEFTKWFNFFSYFEAPKIMVGHSLVARDILILLILSGILFAISFRIFQKKDIF